MVRRIASLFFVCVVLSSVACGDKPRPPPGGGSGGSQPEGGSGGSKPPCENEKKDADNDETGVDCGGDNCKPCGEGQGCIELADCKNGLDCIGIEGSKTCLA